MNFSFTDEQNMIRDMARQYLSDWASSGGLRRIADGKLSHDGGAWREVAVDLGWAGIVVPERYGGSGLGAVERAILMEEMGRVLFAAPFFATCCLATDVILALADEEQKKMLLAPILNEGESATVGWWAKGARSLSPDTLGVRYEKTPQGYLLTGETHYVLAAEAASLVLVAARESQTGEVAVFALKADSPGLNRRSSGSMDPTRPLFILQYDNVIASETARLGDSGRDAWPAFYAALCHSMAALAAEQVGGMQRCLDMTVDYVQERVQFGRKIGSFQAVKHRCADMMVATEASRSAAYYAAAVSAQAAQEIAEAAAIAASYCGDAYFQVAGNALQLHGGIGFTWEYDLHFYFKRARASRSYFGAPDCHRDTLAHMIGLVSVPKQSRENTA
ncbi:acyl-CoA dehydrogenase family protein [Luteithermobacter gelatinilyticus]|uniref:acyl-CoA dehydrogenase family protein n=1 Tax=Luteithermobacter gelatinilyticus TaxID=2582913 RepID=UPI001105FF22|nr:acyl-CoA dehydrogenase family protein [Luteithermobacter gelatinilyticus]